jgi:HEAT repeat protein
MRLFVLAVIALPLTFPALGLPQGKEKDTGKKPDPDKKKKELPVITEIGGKTLDQWIAEITTRDPSKRADAVKTVVMFGPDQAKKAVPIMLDELRKHNPGKQVILDTSVRVNIPLALAMILTSTDEPDAKLIKEAVEVLTPMLRDTQTIVKYRAAQAIGRFGTYARSALKDLIVVARDFNTWETRQAGVLALGAVAFDKEKGPSPDALEAIYNRLNPKTEPASTVRLAAIQALENLGIPDNPKYKLAVEQHLEPVANKDPEPILRIRAHLSLYDINKKLNGSRIAAIAGFLEHPETAVRIEACQALGGIGGEAKGEIPKLLARFEDKEKAVFGWAIWALGNMGKDAAVVAPYLQKIVADEKQPEGIRESAKEALENIQGKKKEPPKKGDGK